MNPHVGRDNIQFVESCPPEAIAETQQAIVDALRAEHFDAMVRKLVPLGDAIQALAQGVTEALAPVTRELGQLFKRAFRTCHRCGRTVRLNRGKFPRRCRTCGDTLGYQREMFDLGKTHAANRQ